MRREGVSSIPGRHGQPASGALRIGPEAVLVPVKAFTQAKRRLAAALPPPEREALARSMAEKVVAAAGALPVAVVCDDNDVAVWARQHGALVIWEPEQGLNRAVEAGVSRLGAAGAVHVTVAHADLPLAADLTWLGGFAGVTLVPDRQGDGTNVACVPTAAGFRFSYGPGSFARHQHEARRLELPLRIVDEPLLAWDVDQPGDLDFGPCRS